MTEKSPYSSDSAGADAPGAASAPRVRHPLAHGVVADVARRIEAGSLVPGEKLPTEVGMMRAYGVSRTVIREAVSRLQAAGLIETRHGIGSFVLGKEEEPAFPLPPAVVGTIRDIIDMMELRIAFETEAAGLAAMRAGQEHINAMRDAVDAFAARLTENGKAVDEDILFHMTLARASANKYFVDIYRYFGKSTIPRTRIDTARYAPIVPPDYLASVNFEHEHILHAIVRRDPEAAKAAMRMHLINSRERFRLIFARSGADEPLLDR